MAEIYSFFNHVKELIYWELYEDEMFDFVSDDDLWDVAYTLAKIELRLQDKDLSKYERR